MPVYPTPMMNSGLVYGQASKLQVCFYMEDFFPNSGFFPCITYVHSCLQTYIIIKFGMIVHLKIEHDFCSKIIRFMYTSLPLNCDLYVIELY